jgi:hypothetical protein
MLELTLVQIIAGCAVAGVVGIIGMWRSLSKWQSTISEAVKLIQQQLNIHEKTCAERQEQQAKDSNAIWETLNWLMRRGA